MAVMLKCAGGDRAAEGGGEEERTARTELGKTGNLKKIEMFFISFFFFRVWFVGLRKVSVLLREIFEGGEEKIIG